MGPAADPRAGGLTDSPPVAEFVDISKRFGRVVACDRVNLALYRGQIHGILGENGAGKSTLMKMLIGLVLPDAGEIRLHGETVTIVDPMEAARMGIAMVHQHFSLVEQLTVWENVALGDSGRLDPSYVRRRVGEISEQYGLEIEPDDRISDLTAGMRQRVEIIKCLRRDPEILVFDEPTSVLSPAESDFLFAALRRVVDDEGKAVTLVSHKLAEVIKASDQITIMRDGRVVDSRPTAGSDPATLARAMVGRDVVLRREHAAFGVVDETEPTRRSVRPATGPPVLRIVGACAKGRDGRVLLDHLELDVHGGEIVGVAGVEGNGQRALGDALSSLLRLDAGRIEIDGNEVPTGEAGAMADAGVAIIPEDRHDSGCVLDFTVAENMFIVHPQRVAQRGLMNRTQMEERTALLIEQFGIVCSGPRAPMWSLSGGNQQRVVLARELSNDPRLLVAAQPTRGLDVGAIEYMSAELRAAADGGVGVLLISTELEEILDLADRIIVISNGRIVGAMGRDKVDIVELGLMMSGAHE
ncbi:MAG: ral nucleoside transport system ATP-binding protein [Ilumatobacteraceae bacterium]